MVTVYSTPMNSEFTAWNDPMKRYELSLVATKRAFVRSNFLISTRSLPNDFTTRMPPSESCRRALMSAIFLRFSVKMTRFW